MASPSSNEKEPKRRKVAEDPFLESMTFASGVPTGRNCDCDECGSMLPLSIATAIKTHKLTEPMRRTQDRTLVARRGGISVWKLTMPRNAEPLVEYGNSHRIVLVDRLPLTSCLKSTGKGILGSSVEENSRKKMDWTQGNGYFVRENGGKAIGFCHDVDSDSDKDENPSDPVGYATVYILKVTLEQLGLDDKYEDWRGIVCGVFQNLLCAPSKRFILDEAECKAIRGVVNELSDDSNA